MDDAQLNVIRADCEQALRGRLFAWQQRQASGRAHFYPLDERDHSLIYARVLDQRHWLRDAEARAYDRFLRARDVLAEALRSSES